MSLPQSITRFFPFLQRRPDAVAEVAGGRETPRLRGTVRFYQTPQGVLVLAEISGLPDKVCRCEEHIFAFHIHSGGSCSGSADEPFSAAQGHFNPECCPHSAHAGDMPPLFSNRGYAFQAFLTDRFTVLEILGRTVIIHDGTDDFTSQPAGNAGARIACGVIRKAGNR
jgi:Cu-Zn family superoxide dismutase